MRKINKEKKVIKIKYRNNFILFDLTVMFLFKKIRKHDIIRIPIIIPSKITGEKTF